MRIRQRSSARPRRGKAIVLIAIMLPALVGLTALSIDVGVIGAARGQLRVAADAGALAGATAVFDQYRIRGTDPSSTEVPAAQSAAKTFAQQNLVLNAVPVFQDNPTNSASGDIVVGAYSPVTKTWTPPPLLTPTSANAVLVNSTRSTDHGGLVPAFFSRIWGYPGTTVKVQSIAMAWNYPIGGFTSSSAPSAAGGSSITANVGLLPIVLDVNTYNSMMAGQTTDQYTWNPATGTVTSGPDGVYESVLYPVSAGLPGNWGTVNVGVTQNSSSIVVNQILYGITPAQMATYPNSTITLPSTFTGNPGIDASLKAPIDQILGQTRTIPIYDTSAANGNNATYHVIAFQPVVILDENFSGQPKYVIVQPSFTKDPTAIPITDPTKWPTSASSGWSWSFTSGGVVRIHLVQ